MGLIALDTAVLVYATGREHPLREPCRRIVGAIGDGRLAATTTVEVIEEFAHVRAARSDRATAHRLATAFATLLDPLEQPDAADLERGLELFEAHPRLGAFDSVLAACALRRSYITALVSPDRGFGDVGGLTHIDPGRAESLDELGI